MRRMALQRRRLLASAAIWEEFDTRRVYNPGYGNLGGISIPIDEHA